MALIDLRPLNLMEEEQKKIKAIERQKEVGGLVTAI